MASFRAAAMLQASGKGPVAVQSPKALKHTWGLLAPVLAGFVFTESACTA